MRFWFFSSTLLRSTAHEIGFIHFVFFSFFSFFFTLSLSSFVVLRHSDDGEIDVKSIREFESESLRADAEKRREASRVLSEAEKRKNPLTVFHKLLNRQRDRTRVILSLKQSSPKRSRISFLCFFCEDYKRGILLCVIKMQTDL